MPDISSSVSDRQRAMNHNSDMGSHSSDWDHLGDIGAGHRNHWRNRRGVLEMYSVLSAMVEGLTKALEGAQQVWED